MSGPLAVRPRLSTGIDGLDELLGGGLLPGTLTVVVGATGIGKTQFGISFSHAGTHQEGRTGILFDLASRGDPQGHADYALRMRNWQPEPVPPNSRVVLDDFFAPERRPGDYLHLFEHSGRKVTRRDLDFQQWQDWQVELAAKLERAIAFFYGNFVRGARRVVLDGIEPVERPSESLQLEMFEYVYHQILRKDADWVARDLFRQRFREFEPQILAHLYKHEDIGCVLLYTSAEAMLEQLIERPLDEGDLLTNANTVIYLGKIRDGSRLRRAMYIPKHRGSKCPEEILPYHIEDSGIVLDPLS